MAPDQRSRCSGHGPARHRHRLRGPSGRRAISVPDPDLEPPRGHGGRGRANGSYGHAIGLQLIASAVDCASVRLTPGSSARGHGAVVTPGPLRIDGLALVVADGLRVRSAPEAGPDSELPGFFGTGTRLFVIDGPAADSGYDWYQVAPIADGEDHGDAWDRTWHDGVSFHPELRYRGIAGPIGWVASAARDGSPWIVGLSLDCQDPDSFFNLYRSPLVALSCYGAAAIQSEGSGGFTIAENGPLDSYVGATGSPRWLMDRSLRRYWFYTGEIDPGEFFGTALDPARFPNGFPDTNSYEWNVVGHFDDQAASTCRTDDGSDHPDDPYDTILMCRATLVITDLAPGLR